MKKERTLLFLGILVAVLPALGFPSLWKQIFSILFGIGIVYIAYLYYHQSKLKEASELKTKSFIDNIENI